MPMLLAASALVLLSSSAPPSWHDTKLSTKARTDALIAELTVDEKVSLLQVSHGRRRHTSLVRHSLRERESLMCLFDGS